jgi:hypothetical protein
VHVAAVVARLVGAERVERHVVVGDLGRDLALEVAHEARGGRVEARGARVHEELDRIRPPHRAPQQPEVVAAHRLGRSGHDDRAALGGHGEQLVVLRARGERRDHELGHAGADRQLHARRGRGARPRVRHQQPAERPLPRDDARPVELDGHAIGGAPREEEGGDDDRGGQREAEVDELQPADHEADAGRDDGGGDDEPAEDAHDAAHGGREAPEAGGRAADGEQHGAQERRAGGALGARCVVSRCRRAVRRGRGPRLRRRHAARFTGGSMSPRMRVRIDSAVTPEKSASGSTMMRCASTGTARSRTSSGVA